jgi:L-seryl-tRNA(Ser) seleniumtransferase
MHQAISASLHRGHRPDRPLGEANDPGQPMRSSSLRGIPSVEKVLNAIGDAGLPRATVLQVVRRELAALRKEKSVPGFEEISSRVLLRLRDLRSSRIQPVINGTGILVHTNFGRAPLAPAVIDTLSRVGSQYNNLEYSLAGGARGGRAAYLEHNLALLCSAESATVVNNNAAALVLILRHFCAAATGNPAQHVPRAGSAARPKDEVIISRGELIQIGGGFRIPDVLESSGARLREVGTTNKTSVADYARAITPRTALILKVHRSNFFMGGFVESPDTEQIAALARKKRIPFVEDLGSGAVIETSGIAGLEHEPTPAEVLRRGVDLVCFSADKLLGGPQAGVITGKGRLIAALKREPFFRALRCDKLILSALETTVDLYLVKGGANGGRQNAAIPVLEMLHAPNEQLAARAEAVVLGLAGLPVQASVGAGRAQVGGGTLPRSEIASVTVDLVHRTLKPQELAARLREHQARVVGYISGGKFKLDLRTVFPRQDAELLRAIREVCLDRQTQHRA